MKQEVLKFDTAFGMHVNISDFLKEKIDEGYRIVTVVPERMDGSVVSELKEATVVVEKKEKNA